LGGQGKVPTTEGTYVSCTVCGTEHHRSPVCERLREAANALDLYAVPGYLTDPRNCIIWANRAFNEAVGSTVSGGPQDRFVPAAIMGPFCECFPRRVDEISRCLPGLREEVDRGNLSASTLPLIDTMADRYPGLVSLIEREPDPWDGTIVFQPKGGRASVMTEQVVPLADAFGKANGFHLSLWFPAGRHAQSAGSVVLDASPRSLSRRQLEVALLYASGLSSKGVAQRARIAPRTARTHLEAIYQRLGVHSRAELATVLAQHGLA
jgi:DNA-binding CsgD family transcriptional regulator